MNCIICSSKLLGLRKKYCSKICYRFANNKQFYSFKLKWQQENKDIKNQCQENYRKNNLAKMAAKEARNRAIKNNAQPKWLNEFHHLWFEEIYDLAKLLGKEVDHILPLKGKTICGLHVPWNLQLLSKSENCKKSNKFGEAL